MIWIELFSNISCQASGQCGSHQPITFNDFQIPKRKPKKDLNKINDSFFMSEDIKMQVQNTIVRLENVVNNQGQLDQLWSEVKDLLLNELKSLPDLPKTNNKKQNKLFKKSQPFWNESLTAA